jgi:hypothetical protein
LVHELVYRVKRSCIEYALLNIQFGGLR